MGGSAPHGEFRVRLRVVVENLLTKNLRVLHATRLRFYQDKELEHCGAGPGRRAQRPSVVRCVKDIRRAVQ
jgi:hypothetical protein